MNLAPSYILTRQPDQSQQTLGFLDIDRKLFPTVELPWKDNEKQHSCIPTGTYLVSKRFTEHLKSHFILHDVQGRDGVCIHAANYSRQLLGCIAPGQGTHVDIDGDGLKDVAHSQAAMMELNILLPDEWHLEIVNG